MTKTDIEKSRAKTLAAAQSAMAEMQSGEFDSEKMMFDIMEADSLDAILESDVVHMKDIIGTPITVNSAELQKSEYEASFIPAYAVMRVTYDDGTDAIVTTGATQIVATLVKAHSAGWFPFRVSTVMLQTGAGNDVIKFVKAPPKK